MRLSVERGFENVLVEDIAAEVGVSTRTFNNYFSSKAEAVTSRHVDRLRAIPPRGRPGHRRADRRGRRTRSVSTPAAAAISAATHEQWLRANPPGPLAPLVRAALAQIAAEHPAPARP